MQISQTPPRGDRAQFLSSRCKLKPCVGAVCGISQRQTAASLQHTMISIGLLHRGISEQAGVLATDRHSWVTAGQLNSSMSSSHFDIRAL